MRPMRLLHTADWHLGRLFHGLHLTADQAHVLDQLADLAKDAEVDAVLVAGDVFDRAVPPPDAVRLLSEILERLVRDVGTRVVLIAGNHDSPERLQFCSGVLSQRGLWVAGRPSVEPMIVELTDDAGPVRIAAVPFIEPAVAREVFGDEELRTHHDALARAVAATRDRLPADGRAVLVAHAWVAGGTASESERPLTVGGADLVGAGALDGFDYVALGHLHRPQRVGADHLRYAGSLLKYSFSEADHVTSVELVEVGADGIHTERIPLTPRRDVRRIEGTLTGLLEAAADDPARDDYLEATLTDPGVVRDPIGRLREVYPNLLSVVRPALAPVGRVGPSLVGERRIDAVELFDAFYRERRGRPLDEDQRSALRDAVETVDARDREAAP